MAYGDTFRLQSVNDADEIKIRGPVWVGIFSFVTLGIYAIYWIYKTAKHLSDYGRAKGYDLGQSPGMTLLACTLGLFVIVPPIVAMYRQAKRIQQAQRLAGLQPYNGWLALALYLVVGPVYFAFVQSELNKVWGVEGGPVPNPEQLPPRLDSAQGPLAGSPEQPVGTFQQR
jgi:hypothetical protein